MTNDLSTSPIFGSLTEMDTVSDCPGFVEFGISSPHNAETDDVASNKNKDSVRRDILQVDFTLITVSRGRRCDSEQRLLSVPHPGILLTTLYVTVTLNNGMYAQHVVIYHQRDTTSQK